LLIIYHVVFLHIDHEKEETLAEDEEHCNEDYVNKGLVPRTVNMKCISPIHNIDSPAITNYPYNLTEEENKSRWTEMKIGQLANWLLQHQVIPKGTIIHTLATKCDGHKECWKGKDELDCDDLDPGTTFLIGTYFNSFFISVLTAPPI
jgi:hypothetical protein